MNRRSTLPAEIGSWLSSLQPRELKEAIVASVERSEGFVVDGRNLEIEIERLDQVYFELAQSGMSEAAFVSFRRARSLSSLLLARWGEVDDAACEFCHSLKVLSIEALKNEIKAAQPGATDNPECAQ